MGVCVFGCLFFSIYGSFYVCVCMCVCVCVYVCVCVWWWTSTKNIILREL